MLNVQELKKKKKEAIQQVVQTLIDNDIDFVIIGGYCRYIIGEEEDFKDIDIVTDTDINLLYKLFPNAGRNLYGGLSLFGVADIWDIKTNVIPVNNFRELYDAYFITYDAIMYHPRTNTWYTDHYYNNVVDINPETESRQTQPLLNALKLEKLMFEKRLALTQRAKEYYDKFKKQLIFFGCEGYVDN